MGFRALNEERKKEKLPFKRIVCIVITCLVAASCVISWFVPYAGWKYYFAYPAVSKRSAGELRIHYLDVGQGDSTLIELPDGKVMLVDGGRGANSSNKSILRYLNVLKIDVIDYFVITHTDKDHCGGVAEILNYKKVLNAYLPHANGIENDEYGRAYEAVVEENCAVFYSSRKVDLSVTEGENSYALSFLYPYSTDAIGGIEMEGNATSAVLWLEYRGVGAIFCGDAPKVVEARLIRDHELGLLPNALDSTELLKVSHHGSEAGTSSAFLEYLGVEAAVISCGADNDYGHPSSAVLDRLAVSGAEVYRTDEQGHIVATISANGKYALRALGK